MDMKSICSSLLLVSISLAVLSCKEEKLEDPVLDWTWEFVCKPLGDITLHTIAIHPEDDDLWFVTSYNTGLLVTRDGGDTWETYFSGNFIPVLELDPNDPSRVFLGGGQDLYMSLDDGKTWRDVHTFPRTIASILVSELDNSIYIGLSWEDSEMANGIYKSNDMGDTWIHYPYKVDAKGLIPWDIEEDAKNQKLYIATEIWDHPEPYDPPFLRSSDGGKSWEDISGSLSWHALKIQVHPLTQDLYVLTEGTGLFYSSNFGDQWKKLGNDFWLDFIIDKNNPQRFWGGNHTAFESSGGVYLSTNGGKKFELKGLDGHICNSLCLNGSSSSLYVASYMSGIYVIK